MTSWKGLTVVQVEALRECLDFLRNGYREENCVSVMGMTYIKLRSDSKASWISVLIRPWDYSIHHDGKKVKSIKTNPDDFRYDCQVDSVMVLRITKKYTSAKIKLVTSSDLPNLDDR